MTPRELMDWGPVRCYALVPRTVIHEGLVIAITADSVLVRDDKSNSMWFPVTQVEAVGSRG